jgi:phage terminase large subunit-like protein
MFGPERQTVVVIPRGNAKTSTAAVIGLHHLLTVPDASVSLGAVSRELAAIAYGVIRNMAEHPALAGRVEARAVASARGALRVPGGGVLRVLSGRGERAVGQTDSLMILDEAWNLRDGGLLDAFQTALIKRPDARLLVISTPAPSLDSPLGQLRARALAGEVAQRGAHIDARAPGLRWLEWGVPEDRELDDLYAVKQANPAPWITRQALLEQRERVTPQAWATMHCGRWGVGEAAWLPPGAWSGCRDEDLLVEDGEEIVLGVDIGGSRAASAVVGVTDDLRVAVVEVFEGDDSVLRATDSVRELAGRFNVREVAFDPWRFKGEALRLEAEGIGPLVDFPQSHSRMVPASEGLHAAVVEQRLRHPGHPALDRHVANAIAKATGRGWRLEKGGRDVQIDAVIALAMAVERAQAPRPVARLLGFL